MTKASLAKFERALSECVPEMDALYRKCYQAQPNYGVELEEMRNSFRMGVRRFLLTGSNGASPSADEIREFLKELVVKDLFLALGCLRGNEHAWWDFDRGYRHYIEHLARHLAKAEAIAVEVIDTVYAELFGTRVVADVRLSKFATYSARGSLRGWLRTVIWHAVVDIHRLRHDEVSVDDWTERGGEIHDRPGWRAEALGGEGAMLDRIVRERFKAATVAALDMSFGALDDHEKLLLLYYHVENLTLRQIANLVEEPASPLRRWFQQAARQRPPVPGSRVHESTVMRWLDRVYRKVLKRFRAQLVEKDGLTPAEVELCVELANQDLAGEDIGRHLIDFSSDNFSKGQAE